MSTRSQIKVKGSEVMIYKHSDGYPEGVIPVLKPILERFVAERGNEPDYALAQIMRAFARHDEEYRKKRLEEAEDEIVKNMYKQPRMTGWGLDTVRHGDIEYLYKVDLEERVIYVLDVWNKKYIDRIYLEKEGE